MRIVTSPMTTTMKTTKSTGLGAICVIFSIGTGEVNRKAVCEAVDAAVDAAVCAGRDGDGGGNGVVGRSSESDTRGSCGGACGDGGGLAGAE